MSPRKLSVLVTGLAFAVDGFLQLQHHQPDQHWGREDRLIEIVFFVGLVASILAVDALCRLVSNGRAGTVGSRLGQVGFAAVAVASIASFVHGGNTLGPVFGVGLVVALVGLGAVAVAGLRDRVFRWPAPMLFAAFLVGMALGDHGGTVLIGVAWLVIGWVLEPATDRAALDAVSLR